MMVKKAVKTITQVNDFDKTRLQIINSQGL